MEIRDIFKNSSLPPLETELLLAFLLNKSREFLLTHPEVKISPKICQKFRLLESKRLNNWPIAYLTGVKEFYGFDFKVNPAVLTPRPETEKIVEDIVAIAKSSALKPIIIDIGTGSGAIIVSAAKELKRSAPAAYRRAEFLAVDISGKALKIAEQNAHNHKLAGKIKFYRGNLITPLRLDKRDLSGHELIIAANLPYLTKAQIKKSPSISREPILALDGGSDGLRYYRELFKQLSSLIKIGNIRIICEIDDSQAKKIKELTNKYFPQVASKIIYDLSGKKRFLAF